jgi:hypothetical protein
MSCKEDEPAATVAMSGFTPTSAFAGETVTITGANFSTLPGDNLVMINGIAATVSSATHTTLKIIVPTQATSGRISVTVNDNTAISASDLTVLQITITEFSPASGIPGTTVVIGGANFSNLPLNNQVSFNGVTATVLTATQTQLTVKVPESATTGKITVTIAGSTATSQGDFSVLQTVIAGFTPSAATVGSAVMITGSNFSANPAENVVKFNDAVATVTSSSNTQLTVIVPPEATNGKLSVTINGKTTSSLPDFTVLLPLITSFSPAATQVGSQLTIHGEHFSPAPIENVVKFYSNVDATILSATENQLVVTVPKDCYSGKISVTVNGKTAISAHDFQLPIPFPVSFFPEIGVPSIPVVIKGTDFSPIASYNIVRFNGVEATVTAATATRLNVVVPEGATTGKISVESGQSTTMAGDFVICESASELVISQIAITSIADDKKSFTFEFNVTNVGGLEADLAKIVLHGRVSPDETSSTGDPDVGDVSLASGGILETGESYLVTNTCDLGPANTVITHPYLIFSILSSSSGALPECSTSNNVAAIKIE